MSERELNNEKELSSEEKTNKKPKPDNSNADYDTVKRALDILKILKEETDSESDSENAMSLGELREKLKEKEVVIDDTFLDINKIYKKRWT